MAEHEEIDEHIEHARNPFDKMVAGSMAIIAACLAVVSVLGQHFNTEKLLTQQLLRHAQVSTTSIYADAIGPERLQLVELMWL